MSESSGEKTEEPTDKKLQDSRKKGQVWQSKDLTGVMVFLAGLGAVQAIWPLVQDELKRMFLYGFDQLGHPDRIPQATAEMMILAVTRLLLLSMPVALACAVIGGASDFLQVGPLFATESLMPKLEKINPLSGLKNMFAKKQFVELLKSMLKISLAAYVVFGVVKGSLGMVVATVHSDTNMTMKVLGELIYLVAVRIGLLFTLFGVFDVWFQRKTYMKDMMMTKDEVKREYKESEGDPHHKAKRRELHQEILEGAQMEAVKGADVVVTNPDHIAVALKYDRAVDQAPRLIAKGFDSRAEAIKALAKQAEVPLLRNVPLAQALVKLDVGEDIPEELYDAVAEVLSFVYGLKEPSFAGERPAGVN